MDITAVKTGAVLEFGITGQLNSDNVTEAEEAVMGWLERGEKQLIGDLTQLEFITSAGLRLVLMFVQKAKAEGAKACLFGLTDRVKQVFDIVGFLELIPVVDDRAAALELVQSE